MALLGLFVSWPSSTWSNISVARVEPHFRRVAKRPTAKTLCRSRIWYLAFCVGLVML